MLADLGVLVLYAVYSCLFAEVRCFCCLVCWFSSLLLLILIVYVCALLLFVWFMCLRCFGLVVVCLLFVCLRGGDCLVGGSCVCVWFWCLLFVLFVDCDLLIMLFACVWVLCGLCVLCVILFLCLCCFIDLFV